MIIKATDAASSASVRPLPRTGRLDGAAARLAVVVPVELLELRREVESLRRQVEQGEGQIQELSTNVTRAYREGEAIGRKAGLKDADLSRAALLALLERGIERATAGFREDCRALERLAVTVAETGLERILDETPHAQALAGVVRRAVAGLELRSIVRVEVSPADFPEPDELVALATAVGRPDVETRTAAELQSGECRVKLLLGEMEVGPRQQWEQLRSLLVELAQPEAAP